MSFGLCTHVCLLCLLLSCVVGWCNPQLIPYSLISGKDLDRCQIMREQREHRKQLLIGFGYEPTPNNSNITHRQYNGGGNVASQKITVAEGGEDDDVESGKDVT